MLITALIYIANLIFVIIVALMESKRPIWAVPWLVVCIIAPIIGPISYFLLTKTPHKTHQQLDKYENTGLPGTSGVTGASGVSRTSGTSGTGVSSVPHGETHFIASALQKLGFRIGHAKVKLIANGTETFDSLIHALCRAKRTIDMDFYIYRNDDIGNVITNLLIRKAQSGIKIRFIRDGIGSHAFSNSEVNRMLAEGIDCRVFHPVHFPWLRPSLNQRDHGKIVIIDRNEAFIGGANVGNEYTGRDPLMGPWRDSELHIISDEMDPLVECFESNWREAVPDGNRRLLRTSETEKGRTKDLPAARQGGSSGALAGARFGGHLRADTEARVDDTGDNSRTGTRTKTANFGQSPLRLISFETAAELKPDFGGAIGGVGTVIEDNPRAAIADEGWENALGPFLDTEIQTVYGNPEKRTDVMRELFFMSVTGSITSVDITTPYFAPDVDLITAMKVAALRNVRVRLLVPRNPDHKLVGLASRTYYPELLLAGVEIYLHEKGILHAKTMVIDRKISIVGATNFDLRSFHLNREVCEVMYSPEIAGNLVSQFEQDLLDATRMTIEDTASDPVERMKERGARLFVPFL
jgi:cardiolipin synthase A/B